MSMLVADLTDSQFQTVARLVYRICGINLKDGKEALVRARLMKRLRALRMASIDEYIALIESSGGADELGVMIDVMTTNKTSFYREPEHFFFLRDHVLKGFRGPRLRLWSAACSSGEEPYTLAILVHEYLPQLLRCDVRILATDISTRMLEKARTGIYAEDLLRPLPAEFRHKYFNRIGKNPATWQVKEAVRRLVTLARLNLMDVWPMRGPFDVIFCRNVMIYFDRATQQQLIDRFYELLAAGGYLMVGHSEGLSAITHRMRYVRPAVYRK